MDTNRRDFIKGAATVMAALPTFRTLSNDHTLGPDADPINLGIIGFGSQGATLSEAAMQIPGVRIRAVCDIWDLSRNKARAYCRGMKQEANAYTDYREMLEKEDKNIDIVLVATPDWMHAEHTNACLRAGKHVYCETPMANSLSRAKSMAQTQRETGKFLQIGNQRRSNPRYIHAINRIIRGSDMLGRIPHAYAQWNRSVAPFVFVRQRVYLPTETLEQYGYENMEQFLNWRWFAKYGNGPFMDRGSRQVDLFLWAWDCAPASVTAVGDNDFYRRQMHDNVTASYEFKTKDGNTSRALYQVLMTTSKGHFYEQFMGENGTLTISEYSDSVSCEMHEGVPAWHTFVAQGLIREHPLKKRVGTRVPVAITCVPTPEIYAGRGADDSFPCVLYKRGNEFWFDVGRNSYRLPIDLRKPAHMPHLENFILAVRQNRPDLLTCPPEVAYRTLVAVLAANESIAKRQTITFTPEDFVV